MADITVAEYLLSRLKEIGIQTVFGVPGDYELALIDQLEPNGLAWAGTPNELIGAYAADGYARTRGAAAVVTTFGPGELSALCGLGGSYCEDVPVVHIVGYPSLRFQKGRPIVLHHTLADGKYDHYVKMSDEISCATTVLNNPSTAGSEIDRVLNAMLYHSKPAYIGIPEDVVEFKISSESLGTKLVQELPAPASDALDQAVTEIVKSLESAKAPLLVIDGGAVRGSWTKDVEPLIQALKIPFLNTSYSKGMAIEQSPYYLGPYVGPVTPQALQACAKADIILWPGCSETDINTIVIPQEVKAKIIDVQRFYTKIKGETYEAGINFVLPKLINAFEDHAPLAKLEAEPMPIPSIPQPEKLEQDWLWSRFTPFFRDGDLIITETGTSNAGIMMTAYPKGVYGWQQTIWGSIGYATGTAVGAAIGAKEAGSSKRLILITGEGSLQMTVQAFSMLARHGITPVIFVLNNGGYTIERYFRGWTSGYNDVAPWDYCALFKAFAPEVETKTFKVHTAVEFDHLLSDSEFNNATYPQLVELFLEKGDAPVALKLGFKIIHAMSGQH